MTPNLWVPPDAGEMTIVRGEAIDLIETFPQYDLLITDPPYAFGNQGVDEHAISASVATVLRDASRKLRPGHWAVVFAASSWRSTAYMIESVRGILEPVRFGSWVKPAARSRVRTPGWAWSSVNVIVMRKPGKPTVGNPVPDLDYIIAPPKQNGRRAELPQEVAEWAVAPFVCEGGLALDPFAGSGALVKAAANAGMAAIGFERSPVEKAA